MKASLLIYEVIGHTVVTMAFLALVAYVLGSRRILRRNVRRATLLFWVILAVGVASLPERDAPRSMLSRGEGIPASVLDVASEYVSMIGLSAIVVLLIGLRVIAERRDSRPWRILSLGPTPTTSRSPAAPQWRACTIPGTPSGALS